MRLEQDYYDVLGVAPGATDEEIKKAFRGLARRLHPDVAEEAPGVERFHAVVAAYRVLSHPKRRSLYDRLGLGGRRAARSEPGVPPVDLELEWYEAERGAAKPVEVEETLVCAGCLGAGVPRGVTPAQCVVCHGSGRWTRLSETPDLRLLEIHPCEACEGRGHDVAPVCDACSGSGRTLARATIRIRVPAGVHEGDLLQVDGVAQRFLLRVGSRPRDSRAVLLVSAAALAAAVGLLLFLLLR